MSVLAILVVLHNLDLDKECPQGLTRSTTSHVVQWNVDPTLRLGKFERREGNQIMISGARKQGNTCRGVGFIGLEVEENTDRSNADQPGEVNIEVMRLWSIGSTSLINTAPCAQDLQVVYILPEQICIFIAQSLDTAPWLTS